MISFLLEVGVLFITSVVTFIFDLFANVDMSGLVEAIETLRPFLQAALYILPAETMGTIFKVIVGIWSARLIIKAIQILPFF